MRIVGQKERSARPDCGCHLDGVWCANVIPGTQTSRFFRDFALQRDGGDVIRVKQDFPVLLSQHRVSMPEGMDQHLQQGYNIRNHLKIAPIRRNEERSNNVQIIRILLGEIDEWCGVQTHNHFF